MKDRSQDGCDSNCEVLIQQDENSAENNFRDNNSSDYHRDGSQHELTCCSNPGQTTCKDDSKVEKVSEDDSDVSKILKSQFHDSNSGEECHQEHKPDVSDVCREHQGQTSDSQVSCEVKSCDPEEKQESGGALNDFMSHKEPYFHHGADSDVSQEHKQQNGDSNSGNTQSHHLDENHKQCNDSTFGHTDIILEKICENNNFETQDYSPVKESKEDPIQSPSNAVPPEFETEILSIPLAPDGGYGWIVCGCAFLVMLILDGMLFTFGVLFLDLLEYFKETKSKTALVGSILMGTHLLVGKYTFAALNTAHSILFSPNFCISGEMYSLHIKGATIRYPGGLGRILK